MKHFKSTNDGEFCCTLVQSRGKTKTLSFHGERSHIHLQVQPNMTAEAGRLYRRGNGDDMLDFAERVIDREVEDSKWLAN